MACPPFSPEAACGHQSALCGQWVLPQLADGHISDLDQPISAVVDDNKVALTELEMKVHYPLWGAFIMNSVFANTQGTL